ncbi:hypothetical protein P0Y35_09005 [Kiritimatiellaeota bacterium B1221]|nr:hypothetical protein [Kiritimatiellaeota bacterium B1221]
MEKSEDTGAQQIRFLAWSEHQPQSLYLQTDAENFVLLSLRSNQRSTLYDLHPSRRVRLFTDGIDAEGNKIKVLVYETTVPDELEEPLLILFSMLRDGKASYRATVMEDAESTFSFGSYRVMNFTPFLLVFEIDGKAHRLKTGEQVIVKPKLQRRENIAVRFYVLENGEPQLIRQTFWRHKPSQRLMVFVIKGKDTQTGDYVLYTITEREAVYRRLHETKNESENEK